MMSNKVAQKAHSSRIAARDRRKFEPRPNRNHAGTAPDPRDWLSAIINGSDDAIISKNLDGLIQSWNAGATRLYGYSADEAVGKPITILIPEERMEEEAAIQAQIQCGKHIERFETKRRRKDGSLVDISLAISVIRNKDGVIVGTSRVAHDITQRLMAQEQQRLLMGEMCHRVKNLFAVAGAIVSISARSSHAKSSHAKSSNSDSPSITVSGHESDVLDDIRARLSSLARAHAMMMVDRSQGAEDQNSLSLVALIQRILAPYEADGRVMIGGNDCSVSGRAIPYLSLLLHELATNAAKFGSLSVGSGRLDVRVASDDDLVRLVWQETGGPAPAIGGPGGFGSRLEQSVMGALSAMIERNWRPTGLAATIAMPKAILTA